MSLKAKIEAVIYAAEEPVTLAQLAAIFQNEAFEIRAARLSAEAATVEAANEPPTEGSPAEATEASEPRSGAQIDVPQASAASLQADGDSERLSATNADPEAAAGSGGEESSSAPEGASIDDEKRAARQRDREIREELRSILTELIAEYANSDRGMEIREIAGGYRVGTKPEYHDAVRSFVKSLKPPMKLSLQALETLAVIAYKQPVTAPEVSEIRGVDSGGVLGSLVSRKLIATAGRKQVIGRPILYKTTKEFLLRFGLKDLTELPSIDEFEKMAGDLADVDEAVEESSSAELAGVETPDTEIASPELPFQPSADEVAEALIEEALEDSEAAAEDAAKAARAIVVSGEGTADNHGSVPGVRVDPEIKPSDMTEANEAEASTALSGEAN
jgi:segregation and condensation protein B